MAPWDIAQHRLRNQHLADNPLATPADVVRWFGGVQAQDYGAAKWGVAQRTRDATDAALDQLLIEGKILRTHVMRPTWHFVMPDDIRWMLRLTAPRVHAAMAYYNRRLELDDALFRRSAALLAASLQGGTQLTRAEVARLFRSRGIELDGQRLGHVLMYAELEAVVCSGGFRGRQFTYALFDERVPPGRNLPRDEAVAALARRYFQSHGPATLQDFSWWSGLTVADARAGVGMLEPNLMHEAMDGKTYWFSPPAAVAGTRYSSVHLLPNYDEHIVAYKDHSASFDRSVLKSVGPDNGPLTRHIIIRNGRVIGEWRRSLRQRTVTIATNLLIPMGKAELAALAAAAARYGTFIGAGVLTVPA